MPFIPVMAKLNFQQPLLQATVSHDPSEIILICWFDAQNIYYHHHWWKQTTIFCCQWFFEE